MAWVRLHDDAMSHPKVVGLSDKAFRLWIWGLSYCQRHLTDGLVAAEAIPARLVRASSGLLTKGLWEAAEGDYRVHDYLDWNDARALVRERQQKAKDRLQRFRNRVQNAVATPLQTPHETLLKPNLSKPNLKEEHVRAFERFWAVYPKHSGRQACEAFWARLAPSKALAAKIQAGAEAYARHVADWKPQFIKAPIRWLEGAHWDDELGGPAAKDYTWSCPHQPACLARHACSVKSELEAARKARSA